MSSEDTFSPLVGVLMGDRSEWDTLRHAASVLDQFEVSHEIQAVCALRTPQLVAEYAAQAEQRGIEVLIVVASGAAHLPALLAAHTPLPILCIGIPSGPLNGAESLLSISNLPRGFPIGSVGIGAAGAANAAHLAVAILATSRPRLRARIAEFRAEQANLLLGNASV